ncbi:MAG: radical SAM protein, partial [Candidatus Moranbacteria bacterium]|nr:radical SAM protein [Candidatus Moranbacteria bacterium]
PSAQLSLAVTYRCNLNCPVCYAKANEINIADLVIENLSNDIVNKINEYPIVFLTGGEPTVRGDLPEIINRFKKAGKKVIMFSNGLKLSNLNYTKKLKKVGLDCVMLQFDALDDAEYQYIRGKKLLATKMRALDNLQKCHLTVYLCSVILRNRGLGQMKRIFDFARQYPVIKNVSVNLLWRLGRYNENDFVPTSQILTRASKINQLTNFDWLESTRLLCGMDKLISMFNSKRRRLFCKCNLKCLMLYYKGRAIPITKIFDTREINRRIEDFYKRRSYVRLCMFLAYFLGSQLIGNLFWNKNFRFLLRKMFCNMLYLLRRKFNLFIPLDVITIGTFPTLTNLDFDFIEKCNFNAISSEDFGFEPGCIHRIKALKKRGEN